MRMSRIISGPLCLALIASAIAQPGQNPNSTDLRGIHPVFVPSPARAAGYTLRTFGPFVNYGGNWFDHTFYQPEQGGAVLATQNEDGSAYVTGLGTYGITTAKHTGAGTWTGVAFGGGMYIEIVCRFTAQATAVSPWASLSMYAIEDLATNSITPANQWPGQAANYGQGIEIDVFEANANGLTAYGNGAHSWYGPLGVGRPDVHTSFSAQPTAPSSLNNTEDVHYGFLWVPAAAGAGSGTLSWYFNGQLRATQVYDPYNAAFAPPPVLGSSAFSVLDIRHVVPVIGTNSTLPMLVKSVSIWQKSDAGNIRQ